MILNEDDEPVYEPSELGFDLEDHDGSTNVFIMDLAETDDCMGNSSITILPDYFGTQDSENTWYVEVPIEKVRNDLISLGFKEF